MEIRPIREEDAKRFLDMLLKLDEQTELMMYEVGERPIDEENMLSSIRVISARESLILIADTGDEIVGFLGADRGEFRRNKYTAYITVGILEDFRNQGLGNAMFQKMEEWAREVEMKRLELTVICHNTQAVKLYEKRGFFIEGIRKKSLYIKDRFVDEYYMGKIL